ncbi:hypothetical protein RRG08_061383 [Elysia crispata]|uniref:Uncharacterized protein n=1 Tax=Elysia crispata TaxID=231223 RepID=A0AAE1AFU2_9GAST|nr:hypothetical protein RRG08_061383 [Elysia crispata]
MRIRVARYDYRSKYCEIGRVEYKIRGHGLGDVQLQGFCRAVSQHGLSPCRHQSMYLAQAGFLGVPGLSLSDDDVYGRPCQTIVDLCSGTRGGVANSACGRETPAPDPAHHRLQQSLSLKGSNPRLSVSVYTGINDMGTSLALGISAAGIYDMGTSLALGISAAGIYDMGTSLVLGISAAGIYDMGTCLALGISAAGIYDMGTSLALGISAAGIYDMGTSLALGISAAGIYDIGTCLALGISAAGIYDMGTSLGIGAAGKYDMWTSLGNIVHARLTRERSKSGRGLCQGLVLHLAYIAHTPVPWCTSSWVTTCSLKGVYQQAINITRQCSA